MTAVVGAGVEKDTHTHTHPYYSNRTPATTSTTTS